MEAENVRHAIEGLIGDAAFIVEVLASLILIFGALRFVTASAVARLRKHKKLSGAFAEARIALGTYILAGLEFLIVADILFTIVNRTLEDVITLAIVAAVRTLISVFLEREIKELREESSE